MNRLARILAAACIACAPLAADAYSLLSAHPNGPRRMTADVDPSLHDFIGATMSFRDAVHQAMDTWNQIGIGPSSDHNFFIDVSPVVTGSACDVDGINEVKFSATICGDAFGSALAVTMIYSDDTIVVETDMVFDSSRTWDVYPGRMQEVSPGVYRFDFMRVAIHEFGHAAGLDHPDEDNQTVDAIMNSRVSDTSAPTADDMAGAHAILWTPAGSPLATLSIGIDGTGDGTVVSAPAGISCHPTCAATFPLSTTVTLQAQAGAGSVFTGWGGACNTRGVVQMTGNKTCTATFNVPPVAPTDAKLATIGTRATVGTGSLVFGGFTISGSPTVKQTVYIVVRGPSLQTLGITQDPLDLPGLRVFDSLGNDVLTNTSAGHGVTTCPAAHTVAIFYRTVRGQELGANDSCVSVSLGGGVYTFTIEPTSADTSGEVLFEVLYNPAPAPGQTASVALKTIGSRATVAAGKTMYGGFTLQQQGTVFLAVRGPSLATLGVTTDALGRPALRLFDAAGADLLQNASGGVAVGGCSATNQTAIYYATTRGQALDANDACTTPRTLQAGVYTFTINPSSNASAPGPKSGEVLFEVTFSH